MAPLLLSYDQSLIDEIHNQQLADIPLPKPLPSTPRMTLKFRSRTTSQVNPVISHSTSPITGSRLLISTGPASALASHPSSRLSWRGCSLPAAAISKAAGNARHVPAIRSSSTSVRCVPWPCFLRQLGLLPTPSPATRLLPPPPLLVDSLVVPPPTNGLVPTPSTTFVPRVTCLSLTRHFRQSRMSTMPPRLRSLLSTDNRLPQSRLIAVLNRVPARPASVPFTADIPSSVSPVVASTATSTTSSGRIRPAHSISDYNRPDFSRSAVPGSVFNLHVKY